MKKTRGYWTKKRVLSSARKHLSPGAWQKADRGAYKAAVRNGWFDKAQRHMHEGKNPPGFWTFERCKAEAKRFNSRSEWQKYSASSYVTARKEGWLDRLCEHMQPKTGFWTKAACLADARKYLSRSAWNRNSPGACARAKKKGWYGACVRHMKRPSNGSRRNVYWFLDPVKRIAYVGLTDDLNRRGMEHLREKKELRDSLKKYNLEFYELGKAFSQKEAIKLERDLIDDLKKQGFTLLNRVTAGSLGGNIIKWTKKACIKEASKHKRIKDWQKASSGSYRAAIRNNWLASCTEHMERLQTHWTIDKCIRNAKGHKTLSSWRKENGGAYNFALRNAILKRCTAHMKPFSQPKGFWGIKENCLREAKKFITRSDWQKTSSASYASAKRNGWLEECTAHMKTYKRHWSKESCIQSAKKYNRVTEWTRGEGAGPYKTALKNGWLKECVSHMDRQKKWTKALVLKEARKFSHVVDWQKASPGSYGKAGKMGWLKECKRHMEKLRGFWTKKACKKDAAKYKTKSEWQKSSNSAYQTSCRKGWLNECCAHMIKLRGKWTKEECIKSARKFDHKTKWAEAVPGAYGSAYSNGWMKECCRHMTVLQGKWTKKACMASAAKFKSKTEWMRICPGASSAARKKGWYHECTKHMTLKIKPRGFWTKRECLKSARKFTTRAAWQKNESSAYRSAVLSGWLSECCVHMKTLRRSWTEKELREDAKVFKGRTEWARNSSAAYSYAQKHGLTQKIFPSDLRS